MKVLPIAALSAGLAFASGVVADGGAVRVHNDDSATVTVNTDEGYGCTANPGDTCSFVMSLGKHHLIATNHDTGKRREQDADITAGGYDFNLSNGNP